MSAYKTILQRFSDKWIPEPFSGCWLWTGTVTTRHGYGALNTGKKPTVRLKAHRVAWELFRGEIPQGIFVLHKCDTRICVNPDHLFLGTHADNMLDKVAKGRQTQGAKSNMFLHSDERILEILNLVRSKKLRTRQVAEKYGISTSHISRLLRGETRKLLLSRASTL